MTEPPSDEGKEARDTVAGCRALAAQDRVRAAASDTRNARGKFEQSASSWDARAEEIEKKARDPAGQRALDRELWASGEEYDPA